MAYAIVHFFPGGTKSQYEASLAAVHPDGGKGLPEGQIFHVSGPSDGGWTIVAVHESRASWEKFRDTILGPALGKGVPGGFTAPPEERTFETHKLEH